MSQYSRAERNANAGIVVGINPADYAHHEGPLAGVAFQRHLESLAYQAGGSTYAAPAQRVGDFLAHRPSTSLGDVIPSYTPGVTPTDLSLCLPDYVLSAIREALPVFARSIPGFDMPGRGDDRGGNPHLIAHPRHPWRRFPVDQYQRAVSSGRRCGLRGRNFVCRG